MTPADAELEVFEYVLGLDGLGLGKKAAGLLARAMARDIRPILLRQREALRPVLAGLEVKAEEVARLEGELVVAWGNCLEQLKVLWLTEGQREEVEGAL